MCTTIGSIHKYSSSSCELTSSTLEAYHSSNCSIEHTLSASCKAACSRVLFTHSLFSYENRASRVMAPQRTRPSVARSLRLLLKSSCSLNIASVALDKRLSRIFQRTIPFNFSFNGSCDIECVNSRTQTSCYRSSTVAAPRNSAARSDHSIECDLTSASLQLLTARRSMTNRQE